MPRTPSAGDTALVSEVGCDDALVEHLILVGRSLSYGQRVILHVAERLTLLHREPQTVSVGLVQVQAISRQATLLNERTRQDGVLATVGVARSRTDVQGICRRLSRTWGGSTISDGST